MSEQRNPHLWPRIAALILGLPMFYVVSFGPACWTSDRTNSGTQLISVVFHPIIKLANGSPRVHAIALWYAGLGAGTGSTPSFDGDELSWWQTVAGPGSTMPYRTTITCDFPGEHEEESIHASPAETKNGTDEID
jgi:hypothetical protein